MCLYSKIDNSSKELKSKQIFDAVIESIRTKVLKIGDSLPSLNDLSFEFDVSKEEVRNLDNVVQKRDCPMFGAPGVHQSLVDLYF